MSGSMRGEHLRVLLYSTLPRGSQRDPPEDTASRNGGLRIFEGYVNLRQARNVDQVLRLEVIPPNGPIRHDFRGPLRSAARSVDEPAFRQSVEILQGYFDTL